MPATSVSQQRAAGAELRRRREGKKRSMFQGMNTEKLGHLAATKHEGLPHSAAARGLADYLKGKGK